VAASVVFAMAVTHLVQVHPDVSPAVKASFPLLSTAALFGLLMAVVGQGGDLLESLIKRGARAKDSASAIPAFGGVLDIIDSLLPTAPIAYWMLVQ
jgi:phosphatidate cytidylyltransferase